MVVEDHAEAARLAAALFDDHRSDRPADGALAAFARALATTAGLDPTDALSDLRASDERGGGRRGRRRRRSGDRGPRRGRVLGSVPVVRGVIGAATDAVTTLVGIDDLIATG